MVARTKQEWLKVLLHLSIGPGNDLSTILHVGLISAPPLQSTNDDDESSRVADSSTLHNTCRYSYYSFRTYLASDGPFQFIDAHEKLPKVAECSTTYPTQLQSILCLYVLSLPDFR
jgi:hypothetical protein